MAAAAIVLYQMADPPADSSLAPVTTPRSDPDLADPATLGEDIAHNIQRAIGYAPGHCAGCLDYHQLYPLRRGIAGRNRAWLGRDGLIAILGRLIAERAAGNPAALDIVIAGSADSQVVAVCAHATLVHAAAALARTRFLVLDLCDTPLRLCRDFAARHELNVATRTVDVSTTGEAFPADIVVIHSLLRFLRPEAHLPMLRRAASWLKPEGRIVISHSLMPARPGSDRRQRNDEAVAMILAAYDAGAFRIAGGRDALESRLRNRRDRSEFAGSAPLHDLFAQAGLESVSDSVATAPVALPGGTTLDLQRMTAVLRRPIR